MVWLITDSRYTHNVNKEVYMTKMVKGYWGSNEMTLGISNYRGFHVVVDSDMGMPVFNSDFRVGIYELEDDYEGIEVMEFSGFSEERCEHKIDEMIDDILAFRARKASRSECTCGAKHTSNPGFHLSWCDKK